MMVTVWFVINTMGHNLPSSSKIRVPALQHSTPRIHRIPQNTITRQMDKNVTAELFLTEKKKGRKKGRKEGIKEGRQRNKK